MPRGQVLIPTDVNDYAGPGNIEHVLFRPSAGGQFYQDINTLMTLDISADPQQTADTLFDTLVTVTCPE